MSRINLAVVHLEVNAYFYSPIMFLKYIRNQNNEKFRSTFHRHVVCGKKQHHPIFQQICTFPFAWNEISNGLPRISNGKKNFSSHDRAIFHSRRYESVFHHSISHRSESLRLGASLKFIHESVTPPTCTFDRKYFSGDCTWLLTLFMTSIAITLARCAFQGY